MLEDRLPGIGHMTSLIHTLNLKCIKNFWVHNLDKINSFYQNWSGMGNGGNWVDPTDKYAKMMGRYKRGFYQKFHQKTLLDTYK